MPQDEVQHDFVGSTPAATSTTTSFTEFLKQKIARDVEMQSPSRDKEQRPEKRVRPAFTTPQKPKAVFATPIKKPAAVFATPQKSETTSMTVAQTPETKKGGQEVDGGQSIYDALGWNDDYDELA